MTSFASEGRLNDPFDPEELDQRYRGRLCALVDREMDRRHRRREDPEDVVQSALRTFFRRAAKGEFQVQHAGALWKLLQTITRRKILKHVEYNDAQKRNPDAEVYADGDQLPARCPTAAEARLLGDVLEAVLGRAKPIDSEILRLQLQGYAISEIVDIVCRGLKPPDPEILQLRLQGHTLGQIADHVGCTRAAVRYKLDRIRDRLRKMLADQTDR